MESSTCTCLRSCSSLYLKLTLAHISSACKIPLSLTSQLPAKAHSRSHLKCLQKPTLAHISSACKSPLSLTSQVPAKAHSRSHLKCLQKPTLAHISSACKSPLSLTSRVPAKAHSLQLACAICSAHSSCGWSYSCISFFNAHSPIMLPLLSISARTPVADTCLGLESTIIAVYHHIIDNSPANRRAPPAKISTCKTFN